MLSNGSMQLCICIVPAQSDSASEIHACMYGCHSNQHGSGIDVLFWPQACINFALGARHAQLQLANKRKYAGSQSNCLHMPQVQGMQAFQEEMLVSGCKPGGQVSLQCSVMPVLPPAEHLLNPI